MTITIEADRIVLAGHATVEDAEVLLAALVDHSRHSIDVSALERAHMAVVQLLLAADRGLVGTPSDAFLRDLVFAGPPSER